MVFVIWLKLFIIGLPLAGALAMRWAAEKWLVDQSRLTILFSGVTALAAVVLFFTGGYSVCIVVSGEQNCLWEGLATILLILGGLGAALTYIADYISRCTPNKKNHPTVLLVMSAWAGMNLFDSLLLWLISWGLLSYVVYRWLSGKGLNWGFMVIRDEYKDN